MSARRLSRVFTSSLRVREDEDPAGDGRTLVGLAVPFGTELDVVDWWDEYTECFEKGAFAKTIRDRSRPVPLLFHHQHRSLGIGRAVNLEETDAGLEAAFHLTEGVQLADEVLALVKDEAISGLSIGFEPVQQRETKGPARTPPSDRDLVVRTEVNLREVSICNFPAYTDAGVTDVRAAQARHPSLAALAAERGRLHELRAVAVDRWGRVRR
jgi:Escherichia/Staphylococcus phage prohead protease